MYHFLAFKSTTFLALGNNKKSRLKPKHHFIMFRQRICERGLGGRRLNYSQQYFFLGHKISKPMRKT